MIKEGLEENQRVRLIEHQLCARRSTCITGEEVPNVYREPVSLLPHFTDEAGDAQRGYIIQPRSYSEGRGSI